MKFNYCYNVEAVWSIPQIPVKSIFQMSSNLHVIILDVVHIRLCRDVSSYSNALNMVRINILKNVAKILSNKEDYKPQKKQIN